MGTTDNKCSSSLFGGSEKSVSMDENRLDLILNRVAKMGPREFDNFVSRLTEYTFKNFDGNFERLSIVTDIFSFIVRLAPAAVRNEIETAFKTSDLWHVKLLMYFTIFGEPSCITEEKLTQKSQWSIPLELYRLKRRGIQEVDKELLQRIISVDNECLYKYCLIALHECFNNDQLIRLEEDMSEARVPLTKLKNTYGPAAVTKCLSTLL